jgi:hypothetical protein
MWVFTTSGFLSAVYKDGALQVRARDRKSLDALAKSTGTTTIAPSSQPISIVYVTQLNLRTVAGKLAIGFLSAAKQA